MSEPRRCPQCDAEIPVNSPAGLCPRCLLKVSADSQSAAEPGPTKLTPPASGFVPPTVEELAPLFPQLEILELLGKGGMGAVYKARQPGLDRQVAVKILPPEISHDPAFAERFQREARALARLSHPHIVAVYDFGETAGLCYIVMEFVDGANLRQAMRTGTLTSAEALAIVPQICEALQFAHDEGIVHRDIKPENILIDKRGRVKIADFGLAKLLGQDASDHSLTATHQVMGTLRYMAPEQMQGSREVDHRADIYSLGVVFYELLTGELPMGKFAPPSKRVQVDVRLDEIVLRALEQQPEQRYQHASELKIDVEHVTSKPMSATDDMSPKPDSLTGRTASISQIVEVPRFSRFAIAGAVWALFGLLAIIPTLFFIGLNRVWNGTALPTDIIYEAPPLAFTIFMGALLAIGAGAPIGTPIYGAIAIGHIKRSGGRIVGLSLAVVDVLFFPLLLLGSAAFGFTHLLQIAFWTKTHTGYVYKADVLVDIIAPNPANRPDMIFLILDLLVAQVVCFFAGLAAWRKIAGHRASMTSPLRDAKSSVASSEPRLSRCALAGAIWAGLGLTALILTAFLFYPSDDVASGVRPTPSNVVRMLGFVMQLLAVALAASSVVGTTICGAVAIGHIKHSGGKLYGMRLAATDTLLFPLLVLGGITFTLTHLTLITVWTNWPGSITTVQSPDSPPPHAYPGESFMIFDAIAALVVCFFVGRAVWRAIAVSRESSSDAAAGNSEPRLNHLAIIGLILVAIGTPIVLFDLCAVVDVVVIPTALGQPIATKGPIHTFGHEIRDSIVFSLAALFVAAILSGFAIDQIKRSDGKLYGLRLAVVNLLMFPMFMLAALVAVPLGMLLVAMHAGLAGTVVSALIGILACVFASRTVWRAILSHDKRADERTESDSLARIEPTPATTPSEAIVAQESLPYLLGWLVSWLLRERWFVTLLQTVSTLIYAICLIAFFSFQSTSTQTNAGTLTKFQVGQPTEWLTLESSSSGRHVRLEYFTWAHAVALIGLAALTVSRRLEWRRSGKSHSLAWHYVVWLLFLAGAVGFGMFTLLGKVP